MTCRHTDSDGYCTMHTSKDINREEEEDNEEKQSLPAKQPEGRKIREQTTTDAWEKKRQLARSVCVHKAKQERAVGEGPHKNGYQINWEGGRGQTLKDSQIWHKNSHWWSKRKDKQKETKEDYKVSRNWGHHWKSRPAITTEDFTSKTP